MPWCDACSRFFTPPSMNADGTCPSCGRVLVEPAADAGTPRAPWHFKVLVGGVSVYLAWRFVQFVAAILQ